MNTIEDRELRPVSLDPTHWRVVRRLLAVEAVVFAVAGAAGLAVGGLGIPLRFGGLAGVDVTPVLCVTALVLAGAAAAAATRQTFARWFCAIVASVTLAMIVISGVAATRSAVGPLGFTDGATLLYAAAFSAHFAAGVWLIPDRIQGPAWVLGGATAARSSAE